jgi:hypothetical protein
MALLAILFRRGYFIKDNLALKLIRIWNNGIKGRKKRQLPMKIGFTTILYDSN